MKYDITKQTAPKMPRLGKGTECVKILLSQVSKDMHAPLIQMLFPILGAHVSGSEFQYSDLTWKELCGQMANLVAESGGNKGQLSLLVEAICRDFRQHDEAELKKLVEWQKTVKTKGVLLGMRKPIVCVAYLKARPICWQGKSSHGDVAGYLDHVPMGQVKGRIYSVYFS